MTDFQPYEPDEPAQPPKARVRAIMAVVLIALVAIAAWGFSWAKGQWSLDTAGPTRTPTSSSTPAQTTAKTSTPAPTPSVQVATPVTSTPASTSTATPSATTTSKPAVDLPGGARVCDSSGAVRAAAGTPRTSCSFALSVRDAWVAAGKGDRTIRAHSSVTNSDYSMTCSGSPLTTCRGGNRAVVYLY